GVLRAQRRIPRVYLVQPARFRIDELHHAGVAELQFTRVDDLDRQQVVAYPQLAQRPLPLRRGYQEVGDDHGQPAPPGRADQRVDQRAEIGPAGPHGGLRDRPDQPLRLLATGPGGQPGDLVAGTSDRADPVATAHGRVADRRGRGD